MVDFSKVTTKKGGRVEIVFEDDNIAQEVNKDYDQRSFQERIHERIKKLGWNIKKGEVIYLLINAQGVGKYMKPSGYDDWNKAEKKDWFHREHPSVPPHVRAIIRSLVISDILGDFGLGDIFGGIMMPQGIPIPGNIGIMIHSYDMNDEDGEEFSGPSAEQLDEIDKLDLDPNAPKIREVAANKNCKACPAPFCERRSSSFSMEAFKEIFEPATKS